MGSNTRANYGSTAPSSSPQESSKHFRLRPGPFIRQWWLEMVSIVYMFLSIFAIVMTLALHQRQPLPKWPWYLSINALLSIYGAIFKGSMLLVVAEALGQVKWLWFKKANPLYDIELFDDATRGPKGAWALLWESRRRLGRSMFPVMGAILTLVSVAVDPFTQQIVHYYSCSTVNTAGLQATISRANNYTSPAIAWNASNINVPVDVQTQGALFAGLYATASSVAADPSFSCSSGDCNFDEDYYSIGVCAKCEDLTSKLVVTKMGGGYDMNHQKLYTLPSEGFYNLSLSKWKSSPWGGHPTLVATSVPNGTISWQSLDIELINYSPSTPGVTVEPPKWTEHGGDIGAARCGIFPCVKRFHASIRAGRLNEKLLASVPLRTGSLFSAPTVQVECLSESEKSELASLGYDLAANPEWVYLHTFRKPIYTALVEEYKPKLAHLNEHKDIPFNKQCLFEYDPRQWRALQNYYVTGWNVDIAGGFFNGTIESQYNLPPEGPPSLMALWNQGNITFASLENTFNAIGTSLTTLMRRENGVTIGKEPAIGNVVENATCVSVRWAWITLPLSLFLLTLVFFVTTLWRSVGHDRNTWKSSSLALFFHGLDRQTRAKYGELATTDEMEDAAKELPVRLQVTEEGWRFSDKIHANIIQG